MNARSLKAINDFLATIADDFSVKVEGNVVKISTFYTVAKDIIDAEGYLEIGAGRYIDNTLTVRQLENGRWICAYWSDMHNQWQSSDFSAAFAKANPQACYCFARSLNALAGDIATYPSAVAAIRSNWK